MTDSLVAPNIISLRRNLPWLIAVAHLLLKGTTNLLYISILSVFLKQFGTEFLPWFYIVLNISFISFQWLVTPFLLGKEGHPLIITTQLIAFCLTLGASLLIDSNHLYILLAGLAITRLLDLISSQAFAAMNNELLSIQEAKSYLSYIYAAGSIGYILSGLMLKLLLDILTFKKLLLLNGIGVSCLIFILIYISRIVALIGLQKPKSEFEDKEKKHKPSVTTFNQALARNLCLSAFLIVFNTFMVDFLYSGVINKHFSSTDSLASFMGIFGASTDLSIIFMQATVMNWLFSAIPMGKVLVSAPAALTMLCLAFWIHPTFAVVVLIQYLVIANSRMITQPSTVIYMGALKQEDRIFYRRDMSIMSSLGSLLVGILLVVTKQYLSPNFLFLLVGIFYVFLSLIHTKLDKSYSETLQNNLVVDEDFDAQDWQKMLELLKYEDRIDKIKTMLSKEKIKIRLIAISACIHLTKEDATNILQEHLLTEKAHLCLLQIAKTLIQKLGNESWLILKKVIKETKEERLVADIIETIGFIGDEDSFGEELIKFTKNKHHRIRSNAIMSILRLSFAKKNILYALESLAQMTYSSNKLYRAASAGVMGEMQLPLFVPALDRLAADTEPAVNKTAAIALYKIKTPRAISILEKMTNHSNLEVKDLAKRLHKEASAENVKKLNFLLHTLNSDERNAMVTEMKTIGLKGLSGIATKILELEHSNIRQDLIKFLNEADELTIELMEETLILLTKEPTNIFQPMLAEFKLLLTEKPTWLRLTEIISRLLRQQTNLAPIKDFYLNILDFMKAETIQLAELLAKSNALKHEKKEYISLWLRILQNSIALLACITEKPAVVLSAFDAATTSDSFALSVAEEILMTYYDKESVLLILKFAKLKLMVSKNLALELTHEILEIKDLNELNYANSKIARYLDENGVKN